MKNIISIKDFSRKEILTIIEETEKIIPYLEEDSLVPIQEIPDKFKITLFFVEPSTRTLGSYDEAGRRLGLERNKIVGPEATSLMKKESFADTIRMLASQGAKVLVMRTPWEGAPRFAIEILSQAGFNISVQNAGDGANQHPTQTFLDLVTIKQILGRLKNFKLGLVGDLKHSRTVHSLLQALRHFPGIRLVLFSTTETRLQEEYKTGFSEVYEVSSLEDLKGCDIIYATRLQRERFKDKGELERAVGSSYLINKEVLDSWGSNVKVMHPLPCVDEIAPEIKSDPRVLMYKQAWYGIPTRMALLLEGYKHRFDPISIPSWSKPKIEVIKKGPQRQHKKGKRFAPLQQAGTIVDHLREGTAEKVEIILRKAKALPRGKGPMQILKEAETDMIPGGIKEILILENRFIPWRLAAVVRLIAPEVTFNVFKKGIHEKVKVGLPDIVPGLFKCPNPDCMANNDPEAKTRFWVNDKNKSISLFCDYCEKTFQLEKVISHTF